ncbi:MAG: FecR domain-containing protein [Planctomycetes bacterium]|nr:FecR domain-containing protein [Planctomycetota bacterium]
MPEDHYNILLARLLDDELTEEQGKQLLALLEEHPNKLQDITRHLGLWDLYSQTTCSQRGAERFLDSWRTRVEAEEDGDRFIRSFEIKLEKESAGQERTDEIERHAQHELEQFMAEHEPLPVAQRSYPRSDWHLGELVRHGVERLCDMLAIGIRVVKVVAVCLAVALAIPTTVRHIQAKRVVATLYASVDAKWTAPPKQPELRRGWLELQEGFAQLTFKNGAEAILQAPCKLRLESREQLFLERGTLAVKVTEPTLQFLVRTPNSTVKDLGTEFGVFVDQNGQTETQVYKGSVQLGEGSQPLTGGKTLVLKRGQAAGVDSAGQIVTAAFEARRLTRTLPKFSAFGIPGKRLDLADALMGGNGFGTGDTNRIVDLRTGEILQREDNTTNPNVTGTFSVVARSLPFVNYLFLPDGEHGPIQVSSEGHTFAQCPDTGGGVFSYVSDSALIRGEPGTIGSVVLNGKDYGTRVDPVISMHANAGITFDLQAIRATLSGADIRRFTALCGISETAGMAVLREAGKAALHRADFWVLVDGQMRLGRAGVQVQTGGIPVNIELNETDRFLTIIVTDGGDGYGYDWGVFAEPALEFE